MMQKRLMVMGFLALGLLLCVYPSSAQSEGLELEHSPNAKRALRHHEAKCAELVSHYLQSIKPHGERFTQTCERHIKRYIAIMDREATALIRNDSIDDAKAVESAIQRVEGLTISLPDQAGLHFLSKANLEVQGNVKATEFGVDLQVNVERAGVIYAKQIEKAFDQYKAKVNAARSTLVGELATILEQEQRDGRLEAVQEVQATIAKLKELPVIKHPTSPNAEASKADERVAQEAKPMKLPADTDGCYVVTYHDAQGRRTHRALVRLSEKGSYSLARYDLNKQEDNWDTVSLPISLVEKRGDWLTLYHDLPGGKGVIYEHQAGQASQKSASYWLDKKDYPIRSASLVCHIEKAEMKYYTGVGLKPGDYIMTMKMRYDTQGQPANKTVRFKAEVFAGSLLITHQSDEDDTTQWQDCKPVLFFGHGGGDILQLTPQRTFADQKDKLILDKSNPDHLKVRYWWSEDWHREGRDASMIGMIQRVD